jgi:predicted nucleotidyltransferase
MLDKETAISAVERYVEAVTKEFSPVAVVLFGSYVNGNPSENSDIDVGILFNGFLGDWRKTSSRLWNLAYDINWDIEPHLLDITQDKSGFVKHIFMTGKIIYQA